MLKIRQKKLAYGRIRETLLLFLYLYPLTIRRQWKLISGIEIDSISISNEIYIYPVLFLLLGLLSFSSRQKGEFNRSTVSLSHFGFVLFGVTIMIVSLLMNIDASFEQSLYASTVIILNIVALAAFNSSDLDSLIKVNRLIIMSTVLYSLLQIYMSFNMRTVANILGNKIQSKNYINENQFRGKLPLGFPTTVVFYFALSIPFVYLEYNRAKTKIRRTACIGASFIILIAALLTGSRGGTALTALMIIWSVYSISERGKVARATAIILALLMGLVFASSYIDLSRIFTRFNDSSTSARIEALITSLRVVLEQPIFGTGIGRYYHRIFDERIISIFGQSTLIDPHNAYTLLMSEIGIVGFIAFAFLFFINIRPVMRIKDSKWKLAARQLLFVFLVYSAIGSQVINEISISIIAWLYVGFFVRFASLEKHSRIKEI